RARGQVDALASVSLTPNEIVEAGVRGDWEKAPAAARWLQDFDPTNAEFVKIQRNNWVRKHLLSLRASIGAGIALFGFTTFKLWQFLSRRSMKRRANTLVQAGDYAAARALYEKLHTILPDDPKVYVPLAHVYMAEANFSAKALPVLGRTWEM